MKVSHLNARSMLNNFNDISTLILDNDFDVAVLTETWLSSCISNDIVQIDGYDFLRSDRDGRGGGVAAYIKQGIRYEEFEIQQHIGNCEYLSIKFRFNSRTVTVIAFYRPPHLSLNKFIEDVDNILSVVCPTTDEILCLGDLNFDFMRSIGPLPTCFESYGLKQLLNEPTRITETSSKLLDPIFFSNEDLVIGVGTLDTSHISDHRLVFISLNLKRKKMTPKIITYRNFRNFNIQDFQCDLERLPWFHLISEENIDEKVKFLNSFILETFDKHAPYITRRVTKPAAPWLTDNLRSMMKQRDLALQKFKKTRSPENWNIYKQLRNLTVTAIRTEKKIYLNSVADGRNSKKAWKALKDLNICASKSTSLPYFLSDPESLKNYLSSISNGHNQNCSSKIEYYSKNSHPGGTSFHFHLTTIREVESIIDGFRSNAAGIDGITLKMISYCRPIIVKYIVHILNVCIEHNYFPYSWKVALGKPIPKSRNPRDYSDLRVICILPLLSKIFEKVLSNQIEQYFNINELLPQTQCGFRKGYSTATALATVIGDIIEAYDSGLASILVLLDYTKAFDTLNHRLLCAKLQYFGFQPESVELMYSYLTGRVQYISIGDTVSSAFDVLAGIPQGSVLGPLLFIIYTSDIITSSKHCSALAYADDTQLYYRFPGGTYEEASRRVNEDLSHLEKLSREHNLILNPNKSKIMCFASKRIREFLTMNMNVVIDTQKLSFADQARNLGLILDTDIRFTEHVKNLLIKAYSNLKLIYHSRHLLDTRAKRTLCESLVLSQFTYCDFIYGPCLIKLDKERIQKVQKSCFRLIHGVRKYEPISHKIKEDKCLNMESRRLYHLGSFTHGIVVNPSSPYFLRRRFVRHSAVHFRATRYNDKFILPHHKTAMFTRGYIYQSISLYNALPSVFKILNINKFKYKLKDFLLNKQ